MSNIENNSPVADTHNKSGGKAYDLKNDPKFLLAKLALTTTLGTNISADELRKQLLEAASNCDDRYLAQVAVYSAIHGKQKDVSAILTALLVTRNSSLARQVFPKVVNRPKMLSKFVECMRKGDVGRKSLGSAAKKLVKGYLSGLSDDALFRASVGINPSIADAIKLSRPRPDTETRGALYAHLIGKPIPNGKDGKAALPVLVTEFEAFKKALESKAEGAAEMALPRVPMAMLTSLPLSSSQWKMLAMGMTIDQLRRNLNSLLKHRVLEDDKIVDMIFEKFSNREAIENTQISPFEWFAAYSNVETTMPKKIKDALGVAAEHSLSNFPVTSGNVVVAVDVSGSMNTPITGSRGSATSKVTSQTAAALIASAVLRKNPDARIMCFDTVVREDVKVSAKNSLVKNAEILSLVRGGGTSCDSVPRDLADRNEKIDLLIVVSDSESWADYRRRDKKTGLMHHWDRLVQINPEAKLVAIDVQATTTSQAANVPNTMCLGGYGEHIGDALGAFLRGNDEATWVKQIEEIKID